MNKETLKGCGCLVGLLASVAALGIGGLFAIGAVVSFLGWPVAAALAAVLALIGGTLIYLAIRFVTAAMQRSREAAPLAPYKSKLAEIDRLMKDVNARLERAAGEGLASYDLRSKLSELKRRKDQVVEGLIEIDAFLKNGNDERRLALESTYLKVRARMASSTLKPELEQNASRVRDIADLVKKVKTDRLALIANLDRIALGLRQIGARLLAPSGSPETVKAEIDKELASLSDGLDIVDRTRAELDALETGNVIPMRDPPKVTR